MAKSTKPADKKSATKKVETNNIDISKELENKEKENIQLKNDLDQLRLMVESLINDKNKLVEKVETNINSNDNTNSSVGFINPREMIKVTSLYHGGLNLTGTNNKSIRFDRFGQQKSIYFEDLEMICSKHETFVKQGLFFIHDDRVIDAMYLQDDYTKIVNVETLKNIFSMSKDEIKNIYNNTTKTLQETILDLFARGINDNNAMCLDRNKIRAINEISGKDIEEIAESIISKESK